jgi:hypothetical protein
MSQGTPFAFTTEIKEYPQPKEGKKGVYHCVKTADGNVNFFSTAHQTPMDLKPGSKWTFTGNISTFKAADGKDISMRWAETANHSDPRYDFPEKVNPKPSSPATPVTQPVTNPVQQMNGAAFGMCLNNATAIALKVCKEGATQEEVHRTIGHWFSVLEMASLTQKWPSYDDVIPF